LAGEHTTFRRGSLRSDHGSCGTSTSCLWRRMGLERPEDTGARSQEAVYEQRSCSNKKLDHREIKMELQEMMDYLESRSTTFEIRFTRKDGWSLDVHHVSGIRCFGNAQTLELAYDEVQRSALKRAEHLRLEGWSF